MFRFCSRQIFLAWAYYKNLDLTVKKKIPDSKKNSNHEVLDDYHFLLIKIQIE